MDPAVLLGVPPDADPSTVRAAFARRMLAVHPDTAARRSGDLSDEVGDLSDEVGELIAARDQLLAGMASTSSAPRPTNMRFQERRRVTDLPRFFRRRRQARRRHLR